MPAARASPSHASRVGAVGRHHAVLPHDLPDPAGPCLQHAPRAGLAWLSLQCTTGRTPRGHVLTAASRASRSDSSPGQNCGGQGAREQPSSEEEPMGTGLGAALPLHRALRCACRAARQPTGAPGPPPGQSPRSVTDQAGEQTEARLARAATGQQAVAAGFSPALPTRWWWKSNTRGTPQRECRNSRSCRLKADATSSFSTAGGGGLGGRGTGATCCLVCGWEQVDSASPAQHDLRAMPGEPNTQPGPLHSRWTQLTERGAEPLRPAHTSLASASAARPSRVAGPTHARPGMRAARGCRTRDARSAARAELGIVGSPAAHRVLLAPVARVHAGDGRAGEREGWRVAERHKSTCPSWPKQGGC